MKNGKFLILLVLVLCFTVFLVSCEEKDAAASSSTEAVTVPPAPEAEVVKHEAHDYFVLDEAPESFECEPMAKYNGEIVDYDDTHNLVALKTQELDVFNQVTDTVTLYNVLTGEQLNSFEATYPLYDEFGKVELTVEIEYPVVRAVKKSYSEDGEEPAFEATYELIKKDATPLHVTEFYKSDDAFYADWVNVYENGLTAVTMGEKVLWIDRNMEVVRSVNAIAANGYEVYSFDSEYQGYLYSWTDDALQIFNREGVCSGTYKQAHKGILKIHVLDDGNVLIQDFKEVDLHTPCNVILGDVRYQMTSLVMNFVDGTVTEKKLDFIVESLQTAYVQECADVTLNERALHMPFKLAAGHDNQAIIYRINDAAQVAKNQEYVVLSNALEIEYALKNTTAGIDYTDAFPLNANLYLAQVFEGGANSMYIFDLDGNVISPLSPMGFLSTDSYVVTERGIYDLKMNPVFDAVANLYELKAIDGANDAVYYSKHNFETDLDEYYVFSKKNPTPTLIPTEKEEPLKGAFEGGYYTCTADRKTVKFYNTAGELKLSVTEMSTSPIFMEDVFTVETTLDGKPVIFVVR